MDSPQRISSRYLYMENKEFDIDLNMLDIEEHDYEAERLVASCIFETFDNTKRATCGPQKVLKFDPNSPTVHQLNLTIKESNKNAADP